MELKWEYFTDIIINPCRRFKFTVQQVEYQKSTEIEPAVWRRKK